MGSFGERIERIVAGLAVSTYVRVNSIEIHAGYHLLRHCRAFSNMLRLN